MKLKNEIAYQITMTYLKFYLAKTRFSSNELIYSCMIGLGYEEVFYDDDDAEGYLTENDRKEIIEFFAQDYPSEYRHGHC